MLRARPGGFALWASLFAADTHEIAQERTEILVIVHDGDPAASAAMDEITAAYRQRFDQRAVLRADTRVAASF